MQNNKNLKSFKSRMMSRQERVFLLNYFQVKILISSSSLSFGTYLCIREEIFFLYDLWRRQEHYQSRSLKSPSSSSFPSLRKCVYMVGLMTVLVWYGERFVVR